MSGLSVEISGNLLSESILNSLAEEAPRHPFAKPESFRWYKYDVIDSQHIHLSRIAEAYDNLKTRWDMLSASFSEMDISDLRDKWIKYFSTQFGYNLDYQKADVIAKSGNRFCLSHRGWIGEHAPIIHTVLFNQDLDHKPDDGRHKYSPHDTLQRYLNQTDKDIWGIVTNGRELRLLRDFHHETRKAYVKFDLEAIFAGRNYNDFRLLWRLIHPSRFIIREENKCILESLFEESKNAGVVIGENLQKNVRVAIESLANGFLLNTPGLIDVLIDNNDKSTQFYQQILRVIYRILFLLYAEQRKLMPTHSALYAQEYSMTSLREKVELQQIIDVHHTDLWEGLKVSFEMAYKGVPELGITPFNGQLFSSDNIEMLNKAKCKNDKLLETIRYMSIFEKDGIMHRISYVELSVDEIGAIYESLLEYIPRVSSKEEIFEDEVFGNRRSRERRIPPRIFFLDPRGTNRKSSGSYYTNPGLVNALIESALVPVLEERLTTAGVKNDLQEKALLSVKVCDPACGSGAFLIAATEYLGERLARIRTQSDYPSDMVIRHARRDVLRHCIYGVDINPMSVELAKVSLWLIAATNDQPLNFLDHKIKCGNSLVGATPKLILKNIPIEAYTAVEGDDKELANQRRSFTREYYRIAQRNGRQRKLGFVDEAYGFKKIMSHDLSEMFQENSAGEIKEIEETYKKSREEEMFLKNKFIADYWTAAFFWRHNNKSEEYPRSEGLEYLINNSAIEIAESLKDKVNELAQEYQFFHWHLEFQEVFKKGGFDCVLGNPPWERIKLQEKEFFGFRMPEIANAATASIRKRMIYDLATEDPKLYAEYEKAKSDSENYSNYIRNSGYYPLTAVGDINTYPIFTELFRNHINDNGRAGIIVPTGVATDDSTKDFFANLVEKKHIVSLYDFENRQKLFPAVDSRMKFCLLTMCGNENKADFEFSFFNTNIEEFTKKENAFSLAKEDFLSINPNTKTCPIFRSSKDAEIVKKIYRIFPVLVDENNEINGNVCNISFMRMFDMTNDSHLFKTKSTLENEGFGLKRNIFEKDGHRYLPLYEAKMIYHYDHRLGSYDGFPENSSSTRLPITTEEMHRNPNYYSIPRYWVNEIEVKNKTQSFNTDWFLAFRDITNSTNERTVVATIVPYSATSPYPSVIFLTERGEDS